MSTYRIQHNKKLGEYRVVQLVPINENSLGISDTLWEEIDSFTFQELYQAQQHLQAIQYKDEKRLLNDPKNWEFID